MFFEIATLRKSIPQDWLDRLRCDPASASSNDMTESKHEPFKSILTMKYKDVYHKLLITNRANTRSSKYWCSKFKNNNIDWKNTFHNIFSSKVIPRKISDFNWKVFYGVIPVENRLKVMRSSNGICKLCDNSLETMQHMFLDCEKLGNIWDCIALLIQNNLKKHFSIDYQTIILGSDLENNDRTIINMVVFMTKWEI